MRFKVFLHPKAARFLEKMDTSLRDQIKQSLGELEDSPEKGEHLRHCPFRRLRIGDYRAIYEIVEEKNEVIILFIGHRKNVCDDFSKLLD